MRWAYVMIGCLIIAALAGCGDGQNTVSELQAAVRENPDSVEARIRLADAYAEREDYHDAFIQYSRARDLDESSFEATLGVARMHEALNDFADAAETVDEALAINPDSADALALKGQIALRRNEISEAVSALEKALESDPANEDAHRQLPIAYLRDEQPEKAEDAARAALEHLPDSVDAHISLATVLVAQDKPDAAEKQLRDAIEIDPENAVAPLRLAELLVQQEESLSEAVSLAERSSGLDPGRGDAQAVAALALRKQGRLEEAVNRLQTAAVSHPRNVRLWLMLASLYRETGEEDAAARAAAMAFRFAPRRRIRGADGGEQAPDASQAPPVEATVEGGPLTPEESPIPTPEVAPGE